MVIKVKSDVKVVLMFDGSNVLVDIWIILEFKFNIDYIFVYMRI